MSSNLQREECYDVVENSDGDFMFVLKNRDGKPDNSRILYDNGEHAIFYRNENTPIILDYLNPEVKLGLDRVKEVLVVEFADNQEDIINEYVVPIKKVKQLPFNKETIDELLEL